MKFKMKRPYQNDGYNCGVFVMYFMYCYGNGIPMTADFNPKTFRKNVAQILLQKSFNMRDTCLYCFLEKQNAFLVMCKFCRRYAHLTCIPGKRKSKTEWNKPSAEFICTLCNIGGPREWMRRH